MIKKFEKDKEYFKRLCINVYCNPKCKGTVFENGKEISNNTKKKSIENFKKKNPYAKKKDIDLLLTILKNMRITIFKNKTTVLKNSFYEGYSKKTIKNIKKKGAISGCSLISTL